MKDSERLVTIHNLIAAADYLLVEKRSHQARSLMETARFAAIRNDEWLKLNKSQIDKDHKIATDVINKAISEGRLP